MIGDIKDCSECILPHRIENYSYIMNRYKDLKDLLLVVDKNKNND